MTLCGESLAPLSPLAASFQVFSIGGQVALMAESLFHLSSFSSVTIDMLFMNNCRCRLTVPRKA